MNLHLDQRPRRIRVTTVMTATAVAVYVALDVIAQLLQPHYRAVTALHYRLESFTRFARAQEEDTRSSAARDPDSHSAWQRLQP